MVSATCSGRQPLPDHKEKLSNIAVMSHSKRDSWSSGSLKPDMLLTESDLVSLPIDMSGFDLSRSTSPFSTRGSSTSVSSSNSETRHDSTDSSTSRSTLEISQYTASRMRQGSNDPCDENACSRCRLSEEEHRRIKAERRKEQNRASQRRFRAKKENEIRGAADQVASLESRIHDLQKHNIELSQTNATLMTRLAELESQRPYDFHAEDHPEDITQSRHCSKAISSNPPTDLIDYFWPVENAGNQQACQLGTYLPLFDHELMPFEV